MNVEAEEKLWFQKESWGGKKGINIYLDVFLICCWVVMLPVWLIKFLLDISHLLCLFFSPLHPCCFPYLLSSTISFPSSFSPSYPIWPHPPPFVPPPFFPPFLPSIMGWAAEFDQQFFKGHRTKRKLSAKSTEGTREGRMILRREASEREIAGRHSGGRWEGKEGDLENTKRTRKVEKVVR